MRRVETLYFEKGGAVHTGETVRAARERAGELEAEAVVVASTTGKTALEAARAFAGTGTRIIAVPFQKHLWEKHRPPDAEIVRECLEMGVEFLPAAPVVRILDSERPDIADAWRTLSQGFKVAMQVASMCVDTGLLQAGSHVISIGGTGWGADTAIAVETYGYADVLRSNVTEIIAMPSR
ncbi:MAG: pyruvate kinase alpha/beta domain-containing protein [Planctomycetota bacterium]